MGRFAIKHGFAGNIGKGLSIWSQVHVTDLARAYIILLHWLESSDSNDIYNNPYFFCENSHEVTWGEAATEIGRVLRHLGKVKSTDTQRILKELYSNCFGAEFTATVIGCNSRSRAIRLRELGWQPREKETLESLRKDELPIILKEKEPFRGHSKAVAS
ncbi:hypothetical protein EJ08DRAFT_703753 [Tothia fuscella]|uniref:NAD-dependent epimerase/dehydratase domain-containing protein n=1 Tax=Tothia fuscella TaxID=1048955 RepID=A0A9P4NE48_9PEZI|nr:hypothetical protein EJ08DRAFT_703753 [Tothia fuscella]